MIKHVSTSFSAVHIYDLLCINLHLSLSAGIIITNSQFDQLPDCLKAQLVEHCTEIAEVMGSNPI